jgi:hypothetical protein
VAQNNPTVGFFSAGHYKGMNGTWWRPERHSATKHFLMFFVVRKGGIFKQLEYSETTIPFNY